jgi:hypothetical protein
MLGEMKKNKMTVTEVKVMIEPSPAVHPLQLIRRAIEESETGLIQRGILPY